MNPTPSPTLPLAGGGSYTLPQAAYISLKGSLGICPRTVYFVGK
jgi:hypothetical protein